MTGKRARLALAGLILAGSACAATSDPQHVTVTGKRLYPAHIETEQATFSGGQTENVPTVWLLKLSDGDCIPVNQQRYASTDIGQRLTVEYEVACD